MLLRNIKPSRRHVNETKYILDQMNSRRLFLIAVSRTHKWNRPTLPRMNCCVGNEKFPIPCFRRCQSQIRICINNAQGLAMTIKQAQGQSISVFLCIYLSVECFSPGQLYVALSRAKNPQNVHVSTENTKNCEKG